MLVHWLEIQPQLCVFKNQVIDRQDKVHNTQMLAEKAIVTAIEALTKATNDPKADQKLLEEARQLHRDANYRWDFVASENSTGFHNPTEALRVLGEAMAWVTRLHKRRPKP